MMKKVRWKNRAVAFIVSFIVLGVGYTWYSGGTSDSRNLTATSSATANQQAKRNSSSKLVPYTITPVTGQLSVDEITANFKKDLMTLEDLSTTLISFVYKNDTKTCASIVASKTSHNHVYYIFLAKLSALEAKYGAYRGSIKLIGQEFKEKYDIRQAVMNKCLSVGYVI